MALKSTIININIANFAASAEIAKEPSLAKKAFVVAKGERNKIILSSSPVALSEQIFPGMYLSRALQIEPKLTVLDSNSQTNTTINNALVKIASSYSPTLVSPSLGNLFLDVKGTERLFGEPVDCALALKNEIYDKLNMGSAIAVAPNKLVAKVVSDTISPIGIAQVKWGEEASFLAKQDLKLLPGVGLATYKLLNVAGFSQIGEIAQLSDAEAVSLLGKRGLSLRNAALGLEANPFLLDSPKEQAIARKVTFFEPALNYDAILAATIAAAEDASLEMRKQKLSTQTLFLRLFWADNSISEHKERFKNFLTLDCELREALSSFIAKSLTKRIRLKALLLKFLDLESSFSEVDFFNFENITSKKKLQNSIDLLRSKFGSEIIRSGTTLYYG